MNRMYKVIWNRAKQCYTVVSEIAVSCTKAPSGRGTRNTAAAVMAAMLLTGGLAFGMPEMVSAAEPAGEPTAPNQYVAYKGNIQYDNYHFDQKSGYYVRNGYSITVTDGDKGYTPLSGNNTIIDVTWLGEYDGKTIPKPTDILESVTSIIEHSGTVTNLGESLNQVIASGYAGASKSGGTAVDGSWNYIIKDPDNGWTNSPLISRNNKKDGYVDLVTGGDRPHGFVFASKDGDLQWDDSFQAYKYKGNIVSLKNTYVIDGKIGVFTNASGTAVYTGQVFGKNNEVLMTANKDGKYYSYWASPVTDPHVYMATYTVDDYNKDKKALSDNDTSLHNDDIKRVKAENVTVDGNKGITIGLIRNGKNENETPVDGAITITSGGGTNGNDTYISLTGKDGTKTVEQQFNTGSKVAATRNSDNQLSTLTINGENYTIPQGKTYTAGKGISIDNGSVITSAVDITDGKNTKVTKVTKEENENEITYKVDVVADGKVEGNNTSIVTGDTVYNALQNISWKAQVNGSDAKTIKKDGTLNFVNGDHISITSETDGIKISTSDLADQNLSNITNKGNTVIKNLAQEAVTVVSGTNTTVTPSTDANKNLTYTVDVNKDLEEIHSINNVNIQKGVDIANDTEGTIKIHALNDGKIGMLDLNNVHVTDQRVGNLSNTEWNDNYKITSGQAATEDQLQKAVKGIQENVDGKEFVLTADKGSKVQRKLSDGIKIAGGTNISTVADNGKGTITVNLDDNIKLTDQGKVAIGDQVQLDGSMLKIDNAKLNKDGLEVGTDGKKATYRDSGVKIQKDGNSAELTDARLTIKGQDGLITKLDDKHLQIGGYTYINSSGIHANNKKITDVADGEISATSKEAVNGSQLKAIADKAEQAQSSHTIVTAEGQTAPEGETYTDGNIQISKKTDPNTKQATYDVKLNDVITLGEDATRKITIDGNDGLITMGSTLNLGYQEGFTNNDKFATPETGYFLTGLGNTTFHIKDGGYKAYAGSSRAATEGQLYDAFDFLNQKIDGITINGTTGKKDESGTGGTTGKDETGGSGSGSGETGGTGTVTGSNNIVVTKDPHTDPDSPGWTLDLNNDKIHLGGKGGSVDIEGNKGSITATDSFTVNKDGKVSSLTADSLTVGGNKYITSAGIDANKQKITNVAPGEISAASMDAVNGSQLYGVKQDVSNNTQNISILNNRIGAVDKHVNEAAAGAAALAALHPLDFDPEDKLSFSAGYGRYKGEGSTALGAYYQPNENILVGTSTTIGNGDEMWNATVSFKLGSGSGLALNRTAMAKKMASMEEENKDLRARVDLLSKQVEVLLNLLDTSKSKDFPDVPKNHWAYEAVSRLGGNGIVDGFPDGEFKGDRTLTRFEMAQMIYNALKQGAKAEARLVEEFRPELEAIASKDGK